ncbi:MAG: hypothetical protein H7318_10445 [Oligoflexus sp.]|nr:hypothetical protein [Oligoflexus sp.]
MRKTDFDTKLIIYRSRQVFLIFSVIVASGIFMTMIVANEKAEMPWFTIAIPIIGLGAFFTGIPRTEEWEYKPWQSKARQVEQQER